MTTRESHTAPPAPSLAGPDRYELHWDAFCRDWEANPELQHLEYLGDDWGSEDYVRWVIESFAAPYSSGQETVLELGPGGGRYTKHLADLCASLICVDVSSEMLARLSWRFTDRSHLVYWKNGGHDLQGIAPDSVDFAFAWNVMVQIAVEDVFGYLRELRRVLRPGGRATFNYAEFSHAKGWQCFLDQHARWAREPGRPGHKSSLTLAVMDMLCGRAGLVVERNQVTNDDAVVIVRKPHPEELVETGAPSDCRRDWSHFDHYVDVLAEDVYHEPVTEQHTIAAQETVEEMLTDLEFETVVELGAGTGPTLDALAALGKQTWAVSIGAEACQHPVLHRDMHFTGLPDASFDLVVARHVVEHSPMPLLLLMEMARIAQRYALVVVPNDDEIWIEWINHYSVLSRPMWRKLFARAGWRVLDEVERPMPPDSAEWRFLLEKVSTGGVPPEA